VAFAFYEYGEIIEPSGAVTLAAALRDVVRNDIPHGPAGYHPAPHTPKVAVVSGGNIQPEVHARLVADYAGAAWA
jgi:threonine dehydratase